jgi:hypothetical protein
MFALVIYYAIVVPVRLAFGIDPKHEAAEHVLTAFFFLDIIFNFNTAIQKKGVYITQRKAIATDYCKIWLWIDLVATIPFDIFLTGGGVARLGRLGKIAKLMRLFKLLRLLKLGRIVKRFKKSNTMNPATILLFQTLGGMLVVLHAAACGYWGILKGQSDQQNVNWYPPREILEHGEFSQQYGYAFFFAISAIVGR